MSASSKKRQRKGEDGEYLNHKARMAKEEADKSRRFTRNSIIVTVIVVVLAVCALLYNTNILYSSFSAVKIGNTSYNVAQYNYFVGATYYTNYYQAVYIDGVEFTKEYEREAVLAAMKEHTALYDAAIAAGYELNDEDNASVQKSLDSMRESAETSGYSNLSQYYAAAYGKGMNEKTYKAILEENAIVSRYTTELVASYEYSQEEIDAQYALYADEFATVSYLYYKVATASEIYGDLEEDAKLAAAKEDADKIAAAADADEFNSLIADTFDVEANTQTTQGKNAYGTSKQWLYDSSRKANETYVYEESDGYMVMMFLSRDNNDYKTANVRHILINAVADEDGTYTDESLEAAKEEIERIEALWLEDPTEENFIALAEEYSEDSGSNTSGGLYENVYKGQMVEEFNDFCFGGRTPGDTGIVYGSSSYYSGYHLIYYVGEGEVYADYLAVEDDEFGLRTTDYASYLESILEKYDISKKLTLRLANSIATA